jgi:nitrate reductase assembly molybdenum cofactor insertion protein NarJ
MNMNIDLHKYTLIAGLFDYPDQNTEALIAETSELLAADYPETTEDFRRYAGSMPGLDLHGREEYFVRTFLVEALIPMDVGYLLFGEDYKRGNFLAFMQQEQVSAGNDLGSELADHLPNMLRLLPLMSDKNMAEELGCSILIPAVGEILKKFEQSDNDYRYAFTALMKVLESDFAGLPYDVYQVNPDKMAGIADEYRCGTEFLEEIGKQKF